MIVYYNSKLYDLNANVQDLDWMMYSNTNKARRIRFSGSAIDAALEISIDCE